MIPEISGLGKIGFFKTNIPTNLFPFGGQFIQFASLFETHQV